MRKHIIADGGRFFLLTIFLAPPLGAVPLMVLFVVLAPGGFSSAPLIVLYGLLFGYLIGFVPAAVAATVCLVFAKYRSISLAEAAVIAAAVCMICAMGYFRQLGGPSTQSFWALIGASTFLALPGVLATIAIGFVGRRHGIFVPTSASWYSGDRS